jgi:hypothetical protein
MRNIFIVNATQVVVSESHPEGVYSTLPDYPKQFDSRSYNATEANPNGDEQRVLEVAQAEFYSRVSAFLAANSTTRAMWTVTLTRADGRQIMRESRGAFPDMTPQPEPEPEPEEQGEQ